MTKQNKDGWIRHRGGKCPVDDGVMVDVRLRDGSGGIEKARYLRWGRDGDDGDIMAYRVCEPVVDRAQVDPAALAEIASINVAHYSENPLQWRDRITQIDADIKFEEERHSSNMVGMDQERADLVAKLAAEGFVLIAAVVEPVEDMSDWRNWKVGDLVFLNAVSEGSAMPVKTMLPITHNDGSRGGHNLLIGNEYYPLVHDLVWHSRPTN